MAKSFWVLFWMASFTLSAAVAGPSSNAPPSDSFRYAPQLIPAVIALAERISLGSSLEKRAPRYVAVAAGKDEYIYQLKNKIFIRCIKNRYEIPSSRICGDFAVVRVELMDESMGTLPPIMAWHMIYREERWQKLVRDEEGHFIRESYDLAELPPYAVRCFERSSD